MKEKFIKKALILALGGFITKILSMVIRIITTRVIGVNGLGLYMLVLPTFNLFITIATLSLPTAISKLVAEGTRNNKKLTHIKYQHRIKKNMKEVLSDLFDTDYYIKHKNEPIMKQFYKTKVAK